MFQENVTVLDLHKNTSVQKFLFFAVKTLLGSLLLALSAQIIIPLPFVPITAQTMVLFVLALLFGRKLILSSILCYFFEGIIGLPVFAGGLSGISVLLSPTGGYAFGFLPAGLTIGYLADNNCLKSIINTYFTLFVGSVMIFLCGTLQLSLFVNPDQLFFIGVLPFIPGEIIKIMLAVGIIKFIRPNSFS